MSLINVENALMQSYQDAGLSLPTAYENVGFDKPSTAWASVFHLPDPPEMYSLSEDGFDEATGILQVDINVPADSGTAVANGHFDTLRAHYKAGARFTSGGQQVVILRCGKSQGRVIDGFYRISISIYWIAYIQR